MRSGRLFLFNKRNILLLGLFSLLIAVPDRSVASVLVITNAWIKLAPPVSSVNAAYMSLANPTGQVVRIVKITADCCAMASFHQTRLDGEAATMVHLDALEIRPHSSVELLPGGLHIMLMKSEHSLKKHEQVQLEFTMDDGRIQHISAQVRAVYE